jgi:prepilin-type N-terminal cleavage/methylation domain-containing protein
MKRTMPPAFTLAELMVVIAVIGLLVALMLPSFSQVIKVTHQSMCANNLEHLGQAITTLGANVHISAASPLSPMGWRGQIDNYIGHDKAVMLCPDGFNDGMTAQGLGAYALRTYSGSTFLYDMPMVEGPACKKINVSADGSSFDLSFEDQRTSDGSPTGDFSFANPIMHVEFSGNDVIISVSPLPAGGGYIWDLVDPKGNVLIPSVLKTSPPGTKTTLSGVGTPFSYGLNSVAPSLKSSDDRIMALDYPAEIARVAGVNETRDNWMTWTDTDGQFTFARHMGRCNVLMANGRVVHLSPQQIDPTNATLVSQYWKP